MPSHVTEDSNHPAVRKCYAHAHISAAFPPGGARVVVIAAAECQLWQCALMSLRRRSRVVVEEVDAVEPPASSRDAALAAAAKPKPAKRAKKRRVKAPAARSAPEPADKNGAAEPSAMDFLRSLPDVSCIVGGYAGLFDPLGCQGFQAGGASGAASSVCAHCGRSATVHELRIDSMEGAGDVSLSGSTASAAVWLERAATLVRWARAALTQVCSFAWCDAGVATDVHVWWAGAGVGLAPNPVRAEVRISTTHVFGKKMIPRRVCVRACARAPPPARLSSSRLHSLLTLPNRRRAQVRCVHPACL